MKKIISSSQVYFKVQISLNKRAKQSLEHGGCSLVVESEIQNGSRLYLTKATKPIYIPPHRLSLQSDIGIIPSGSDLCSFLFVIVSTNCTQQKWLMWLLRLGHKNQASTWFILSQTTHPGEGILLAVKTTKQSWEKNRGPQSMANVNCQPCEGAIFKVGTSASVKTSGICSPSQHMPVTA